MAANSITYTENFHNPSNTADLTFPMDKLLKRCDDPILETERKHIVGVVYNAFDYANNFIQRSTKSLLERLEQQREEEIIPLAKKAKKEFEKLEAKKMLFNAAIQRCTEEMNIASQNLSAEKNFTLPAPYTTKAEYAAHDALIATLQEKVNDCVRAYNNQMSLQNSYEASLAEAAKIHNELIVKHQNIQQQIDRLLGKKVQSFSRTYGLQE